MVMDSYQIGILKSLTKTAPSLAGLYEGAVKMLQNRQFPGRLRFIAHAVREIANRLPGAVGGEVTKKHLDYHQEIGLIADVWKKEGLANTVAVESGEQRGPGLSISHGLAAKVNALIDKDHEVSTRKEDNVRAMMHKLVPESRDTGESLAPIIDQWLDVVKWFVDNVHEGEEERQPVDESAIQQKFRVFENALRGLLLAFYSGLGEVERIVEIANSYEREPTAEEVEQALSLLFVPQYRSWFFENLQNPLWLSPLKAKGLFAAPPEPLEDKQMGTVRYPYWPESAYLKRIAKDRSPQVVEIIIGLRGVTNPLVKTECIEALCEMAPADAAKGVPFVKDAMKERTTYNWHWEGQAAAELMLKLGESGKEEAFHIAYLLLDLWAPSDREKRLWHDTTARFTTYHYMHLVLEFYKKIWETNARRAVSVLLKILNRHLVELSKDSDYDRSEHFYVGIENLDAIDRLERDYKAVLIKGVCEAGKVVVEKQPEKVDELLERLRAMDKAIFKRVEMYLLRFVAKGTHHDRITEVLLDKGLFAAPGFRYEYDLLMRDKIGEVRDAVEGTYREWIEEIGVRDKEDFAKWFRETRERDATDEDITRYESQMRAARVYLVKGQFPELYARHRERAGLTDEQLAPMPRIGTAHWAAAEESPLPMEDMLKMEPGEVLDYLLEPAKYRGKRKPDMWHEPEESLAYVFGEVVRQRLADYVDHGLNSRLIRLDSGFLGTYLNRVMAGVREKDLGGAIWGPWLELAESVVRTCADKPKYRGCLADILWTMQEGFRERNPMELDKKNMETVWHILAPLVRYAEEDGDAESPKDEDPMQMLCRSVRGNALEQVVSFALACRKRQKDYYEEHLQAEVKAVLDYVVSEVKRPEVNCAFGSEFARIYRLDQEWLGKNLDGIFEADMWDAVWGTYVSWARPWPNTFKLLADSGRYEHAVDLIGTANKYRFEKDPEEGLVEHLMIALFNGWLAAGCDDKLLLQFLKRAPAQLRGHAAEFLTTGFESLKKEGANHGIADRLRDYWEKRLAAMNRQPEDNLEEAIAFIGWAEDSPVGPAETLDLLYRTLELTEGRLGRHGYEFVKSVCAMGKGNELMAIRCLKKAAADDEVAMYFSGYERELTEFMESLVRLADDYPNIGDIRKEAMQLADAYGRKLVGRRDVDKLREVFETLSLKVGAM